MSETREAAISHTAGPSGRSSPHVRRARRGAPPTRPTWLWPKSVTTGTPIQSDSHVVVCPLYGKVSSATSTAGQRRQLIAGARRPAADTLHIDATNFEFPQDRSSRLAIRDERAPHHRRTRTRCASGTAASTPASASHTALVNLLKRWNTPKVGRRLVRQGSGTDLNI